MSNELTKTFFDTFGIEPRYEDACTVEDKYWANEELANEYGTFDQYMNCKCENQENCTTECSCAYQKEIYPQITDSMLLELICTLNKSRLVSAVNLNDVNYEDLKNTILKKNITILKNEFLNHEIKNEFKHQVKALFKEIADE